MSFWTQCDCGARYKLPGEHAGRKVRCKACGETFRADAEVEMEPAEAVAAVASQAATRQSAPAAKAPRLAPPRPSAGRHRR